MDVNPPSPPGQPEGSSQQPAIDTSQQPQTPQQPYQPPPQQYPPAAGYPPPPQKKGFNWLACCGITCGIVLIIAIVAFLLMFRSCQSFIEWIESIEQVGSDVEQTESSTIRASAISVSSINVASSPESHEGQWLAIDGEIIPGAPFGGMAFTAGKFTSANSTTYLLDGDLSVMDISLSPSVGDVGDRIRAYGKVGIMDMSKIPIFGSFMGMAMEEAAKSDPSVQDQVKIIFVITKDVELVSGEDDMQLSVPPEGESTGEAASGWID